jgi:hypothetical protein
MTRRVSLFIVAIAAFAVMTLPALAKSNSNPILKTTFDVSSAMKVGSTTLAPGHYEVQVEGNQAKFQKDGKAVAEVPCTVKEQPNKAANSAIHIDDHNQITEIQVSGKTQAIEFSTAPEAGN